jgi:hypothetical protein
MDWDTVAGNRTQRSSAEQWNNFTNDRAEARARLVVVDSSTARRTFTQPNDPD